MAAVSAFTGFMTLFVVNDCQPVGINPNLTDVNKAYFYLIYLNFLQLNIFGVDFYLAISSGF